MRNELRGDPLGTIHDGTRALNKAGCFADPHGKMLVHVCSLRNKGLEFLIDTLECAAQALAD